MKAELLTLLIPSTQSFELSSTHHNKTTSEDINMLLSYSNLDKKEYSLLLMKYVDDKTSESSLFDELFDEVCEIFLKREVPKECGMIRKFLNTAIIECCVEKCVVCQGTGYLKTTDSIDKCPHCDGTGEFIYDDHVRSSIMGVKKNYFMKYKKEYESIIEKINTIENSALSKIGDT